jgi:hypothetical protein
LVLWFSSCRYGVELRVMCPVCGLLQHLLRPREVKVLCLDDMGSKIRTEP